METKHTIQEYYLILIFTFALIFHSCQINNSDIKESVLFTLDKEIKWVDSSIWEILDVPIQYDMSNSDFKIITVVDSSDCISCKMKLEAWNLLINEFKQITDLDISFGMIIEHEKTKTLSAALHSRHFYLPVFFDPSTSFRLANDIKNSSETNTFLINSDDRIIAIGNPIINPKVKKLYFSLITNRQLDTFNRLSNPFIEGEKSKNIGLVKPAQEKKVIFTIKNITNDTLNVEDIVPSCDCVVGMCSNKIIAPYTEFDLSVSITPDSINGFFSRSIDLFFNEIEIPTKFIIHGYNTQF